NPIRNAANWVAWRLETSDLGSAHRKNDFKADPLLPLEFYRVTPQDYAHSGYDRGHLCPSGDRTRDAEENSITFRMTNMLPQVHELNAGPWEKLEQYERKRAVASDGSLYIVAGGVFSGAPRVIGNGVAVPSASYKIIVVLAKGQPVAEVSAASEVIAVRIPNEPSVAGRPFRDFVVAVDDLENETGYNFLGGVSEPIQRALEATRHAVAN
ncbi:MAG TPA: DNA/RNA non-specific endonuclease, partial [Polyangiaceae bacterium]|nr:DNA/RNA non-specific endonuclease [Polyangiaceae bacterium]